MSASADFGALTQECSDPVTRPRSSATHSATLRLYLTPVEHLQLEKRVGNQGNISARVRAFIDDDIHCLAQSLLATREGSRQRRKLLKIQVTPEQKAHIDSAAKATKKSTSDYLVCRLLKLPECGPPRPPRQTLSDHAKLVLVMRCIAKLLDAYHAQTSAAMKAGVDVRPLMEDLVREVKRAAESPAGLPPVVSGNLNAAQTG